MNDTINDTGLPVEMPPNEDECDQSKVFTLGRSDGPANNTIVKPHQFTLDGFAEALRTPDVGPKDGSYVTLSIFKNNHRSNANATLPLPGFFLDGDSSIDAASGEISEGAPPPEYVHDALVELDVLHVIYSSHSHGKKGNRYRVFIPAEINSQQELSACVDWIIELLHQKQVMLANTIENHTISQPWYLPRISHVGAPFFFAEHSE